MPGAHSVLNLESYSALTFLLLVLARSRKGAVPHQINPVRETTPAHFAVLGLVLCSLVVLFYGQALKIPFVYDDYIHITNARNSTWHSIAGAFGPIRTGPGIAFRPFGFLVYWMNYLLAGTDPFWWHSSIFAFHIVNSLLVFAFCLELQFSAAGSAAAAILFALNASSVEALAWTDARFDPIATVFILASLVCVCRFLRFGRTRWLILGCIAAAAATLSKESAFCLPLLVAAIWLLRQGRVDRTRYFWACGCTGALAGLLFAYRWWAIGGIGGYRTSAGEVNIARFHVLQTLNAVFVRDWTILFYPVNWSHLPGWVLLGFLFSSPVVLASCAWLTNVPWRVYLGCLAFTMLAALPVQHLLLLGTDLANARLFYLLSVGWAMLWGLILTSLPGPRYRILLFSWLLVWHGLMLRHNLLFWLRVPFEARAVCAAFAREVQTIPEQAVVTGLPQKKEGVVFLANGFPECVAMNGNISTSRVRVTGEPNYRWNAARQWIEKVTDPTVF